MVNVPRFREEIRLPIFCVDDCIATFAKERNLIYQALYLDELRMNIAGSEGSYKINFSDDFLDSLRLYGGIRLEKISEEDCTVDGLKDFLGGNSSIIMEFKGTECPWDWRYQSVDWGNHTFLIENWDDRKNVFTGKDPFYHKEHIELKISQLMKGYVEGKAISGCPIEDHDILGAFRSKLIDEKEYYSQLEHGLFLLFSAGNLSSVASALKEKDQFNDFGIENCEMNVSLLNCVYSRLRYAILLTFLAEKYHLSPIKESVVPVYIELSRLWEKIRNKVIKKFVSGSYTAEERFEQLIRDVLQKEREAQMQLIKISEKYGTEQ